MEEEIKEEERSADEAGKDGDAVVVDVDDPLWVKYMEAKLDSKSKHCQPSHPITIGPVPRDIRMVDTQAYEPLFVSIGPYYRGNQSLVDMEEVKWRNLKDFRGRAGESFNKYLKTMKEIAPQARACYSGNIDMEADEFIEMMLLDGLFIIEFLRTRGYSFLALLGFFDINEKEPIYAGMLSRVGRDIFLLENQLPFFVLEHLWKLTDQWSKFDRWSSAWLFIRHYALPFEHEWKTAVLQEIFDEEEDKKKREGENPEMINEDGVNHLLHLVHLLLKPTSLTKKSKPMESKPRAFIKKMITLSFLPPRCRDRFRSPSGQESQSMKCTSKLPADLKKILHFLSPCMSKDEKPPPLTVIPSATELDEAGVKFKCVPAESFLDIKFERGTMNMPRLSVEDSTISLLRNFIAFEQSFPNRGSHFTSYCNFMDNLVNTPRDMEILKKSGIIENLLGSDKEVADLFNDLCKGIVVPDDDHDYLANPSEGVRNYTKRVWPTWRAKLLRDYFGSPWSIISFFGATFVIILTIVQTYYAVFT